MEAILHIVVLLLIAGAVVTWRRRSQLPRPGPRSAPTRGGLQLAGPLPGRQATLTLDIVAAHPDSPAVQRPVHEAASWVFRTSPAVEPVIVEDRAGTRLGMVERDQQDPGPISVGLAVPEPDRQRSRRSSASGG
ncbi:MAG: hypothetical protein M3O70_07340 [Actinomycetota bacterium]|nr:hypothetical protein [Actinomycetota bacterium]